MGRLRTMQTGILLPETGQENRLSSSPPIELEVDQVGKPNESD